jgi:hypothetical protein
LTFSLFLDHMKKGVNTEVKSLFEVYQQYRNIGGYPTNIYITFFNEDGTELPVYARGIPAEQFHPSPEDYPAVLEDIARFEWSEMNRQDPENTISKVRVSYRPESGTEGKFVLPTREVK